MHINNSNSKYILATFFVFVLAVPFPFSCFNIGKKKVVTPEKEYKGDIVKYDKYLEKDPDIRVLLLKNTKKAEIEINTSFSILDMDTGFVLAQETNLPESIIYANSGRLHIEPVSSHTTPTISRSLKKSKGKIRITLENNGFIKLDNLKYAGDLLIIPKGTDKFSVLEEIDMERYLPGVVASEMPIKWQDDAILAQVVAARSYAVYQKTIKKNSPYHINKLDLAYKGSYKRSPKIEKIVNKSSGIVMVYNWELLPGYFHSTCGGHTEDINHVFGLKSILPLSGVNCERCDNSKFYRWKREIKKNEIEKKLRNSRVYVKNISYIEGEQIGPGGHYSTIKLKHSKGVKKLNANDFRLMVGPGKLLSTAFEARNNGSSVMFEGRGWGHGVGLCQYGTQDMAKSGYKWIDILKHYYPGVELVKIY